MSAEGGKMSEFERNVIQSMSSEMRALLWILKATELLELSEMFGEEEVTLLADCLGGRHRVKREGGKHHGTE